MADFMQILGGFRWFQVVPCFSQYVCNLGQNYMYVLAILT